MPSSDPPTTSAPQPGKAAPGVPNAHDSGYRLLFSHPEFVRDLISGFVQDDWLAQLDYATLEPFPGHYVTEDLRTRSDDVVWRVKVAGVWVYLYVVIEFQSTIDRYMALRMMVYVGLLYQNLIKQGQALADGRLPPVLPIVLYNGSPRWNAKEDIAELIPLVPGLVAQFKPSMKYLLIDEGAHVDAHSPALKNLVAAIFRLEHPATPAVITSTISALHDWLADRPDINRTILIWLRAFMRRRKLYTEYFDQVESLKELSMALNERMDEWAEAYREEGIEKGLVRGLEKGRQEGRQEGVQTGIKLGHEEGLRMGSANALLKLLTKRFGPVSTALQTQIYAATLAQIEAWFDRTTEVTTLNQVFDNMAPR